MSSSEVDVAIVGAGAAGIGAALEARRLGLQTAWLEAKPRLGGRAWTDTTSFAVPIDRGCTWLHSADRNPLTGLARKHGFELVDFEGTQRVWDGGFLTQQECDAYEAAVERCDEAGDAAAERGEDVPLADVIEPEARWAPFVSRWIAATCGAEPEHLSTLDYSRYVDTDVNLALREGYGALVTRLAGGLAPELECPVSRIDWSGPGVRLETPRGSVSARSVLVTVSTGVLASGTLGFAPELPDWKREAIEAIPMGLANKIVIEIDRSRLELEPGFVTTPTFGFQLCPFGSDLVVAWAAGEAGRELEHAGREASVAHAVDALRDMLGSSVDGCVRRSDSTAWGSDPQVLGSYSFARPGAAEQRAVLAQPLADRVYFAGEATSHDAYSTAHGAWLTGEQVLRHAAERFGAGLELDAPGRLR